MAFSYRWSDLIRLVSSQVKNIPTQQLDVLHCDLVSSRIAARLPWKPQQQSIADGQIPLINGVQDYDAPFNIWRLIDASLRCTSVTPNDDITIAVRDSLPVDLYSRSPYAVTSVALQAPEGKLRLSSAVIIPAGTTWELRGSYQINVAKVSSTKQNLWFDDRYVSAAIEGLTYWYYKLADDPRAGTTTGNWPGDITYSGQLAQFMSAIKEMADAEDIGGDMQTMPGTPLGQTAGLHGSMIAMYGTGGGVSPTASGVVSINNDLTQAQYLVGGVGITITDTGNGYHLIYATASTGTVHFVDNETVAGSGTIWTLANAPSPPSCLQLFQALPGFGNILLKINVDYTLSGKNISTINSLAAGALTGWYRY